MKSPKAPAAPNPAQVSQAQTQSNQQTAGYQNAIDHGNTSTPWGSQTFTPRVDPTTGATMYDQSVTLAPEQQQLLDLQNQQDLSLGQTSNNMLGQVSDTYSKPMDTSGLPAHTGSVDATGGPALQGSLDRSNLPSLYGADDLEGARQNVSDALYRRQSAYLDPQYNQADQAMRSRLANQGITEGSEAWKNSIDEFERNKAFNYQQARDSSITGGLAEMQGLSGIASQNRGQMFGEELDSGNYNNAARAQALQESIAKGQFGNASRDAALNEQFALRNQPLNEYNSLRTASQVSAPQFQNPQNAQVQPTDVSGNIWNAYNGNMNAAAMRSQSNGNFMSGLMNLGGQLGSAYIGNMASAASDERVKSDVEPVGELEPGMGVYEYEYTGDPLHERHTGVMAQEVERIDPHAVITGHDGVKRVDYSRVLARALAKRAA